MIKKMDLGAVSAYALAVEKGYTGTEEEFTELLTNTLNYATQAQESASAAAGSAEEAGRYKTQAGEILASVNLAGTQQIEAIESAGTQQTNAAKEAIEAKGKETLDSIPDSYEALQGDVTQLRGDSTYSYISNEVTINPSSGNVILTVNVNLKSKNEYKVSLVKNSISILPVTWSRITFDDGTTLNNQFFDITTGYSMYTPEKNVKKIELQFSTNYITAQDTVHIEIDKTGRVNTFNNTLYYPNLTWNDSVVDIKVEKSYVENGAGIYYMMYNKLEGTLTLALIDDTSSQFLFNVYELSGNVKTVHFWSKYGAGCITFNLSESFRYSSPIIIFGEKNVFERDEIINYRALSNRTSIDETWMQYNVSNKNADNKTREFYAQLYNISNKGCTLYGQQYDYILGLDTNGATKNSPNDYYCQMGTDGKYVPKADVNLDEYGSIYRISGKHGGILAQELGKVLEEYLSENNNEYYKSRLLCVIKNYHERFGGAVTLCCHANNPYGGDYRTVNTEHPDIFAEILSDGVNASKTWFYNFLDFCVDFFNSMVDKHGNKIPVLFRPFHESKYKDTFWWNYCSAEDYKKVWVMMHEYISERCTNVLYVFSVMQSKNGVANGYRRYAGDSYVDVIGVDLYFDKTVIISENDILSWLYCTGIIDIYNFAKTHGKVCSIPEIGDVGNRFINFWNYVVFLVFRITGIYPAYAVSWYNTPDSIWTPYNPTSSSGGKYLEYLNNNSIYLFE